MSNTLAVQQLRTEFADRPMAVEVRQPRFSWQLHSTRRDSRQVAYRVVVHCQEAAQRRLLWDSAWVDSCASLEIPYQGEPLDSQMEVAWSVSVRDDAGQQASSPEARFDMGLLHADDWQGEWIEAELPAHRARRLQGELVMEEPVVLLRSEFELRKPVAKARLYATALGAYDAHINGLSASPALLAPEISAAQSHLYYQVHDITALLQSGRNAVGLRVADGYYAGRYFWSNAPRFAFGPGPRRVRAFIEVTHTDGSRSLIATGRHWKLTASATTHSSLYDGEHHDARLECEGWAKVGFDDADWDAVAACVGPGPALRLVGQNSPAITALATVAATASHSTDASTRIFDFGRNMAGVCRLQAHGQAGDRLLLRFAETLHPDGSLDTRNLRTAQASDQYVLKGAPDGESWTPSFTTHGFRYASLSGKLVERGQADIQAITVGSQCRTTGRMRFPASPLLQGIFDNAFNSQQANFMAIPTDCPQRDERAGWLADIQLFADAAAYNMDVDAFLRRYLNEIRACQQADGAVGAVAPLPAGVQSGVSSGWSEACVVLPWTLYQRYGDTRVIEENWEMMQRWMYYIHAHNPDGLWQHGRGWDLGDWLAVDAKDPAEETTPKLLCATAYWAHSARLMSEMAAAINQPRVAQQYAELRQLIESRFAAKFVHADGRVGNGSQSSYALALQFGLVPASLRQVAARHLADDVRRRGFHLSTGILGTACLLDALADNDQVETALSLLLQDQCPSWGYMVKQGATSMWERWDSDVRGDAEQADTHMNSYNHYMFGAVAGFLYRRLGGIEAAAPGFGQLCVRPLFDARIGPVETEFEGAHGRIATRTDGDAAGLQQFQIEIPANTQAEILLPAGEWHEGGERVPTDTQPTGLQRICVGSGSYDFHKTRLN